MTTELPATISFKLSLTQADIAAGAQGQCYACPVALAMNREVHKILGEGWYSYAHQFMLRVKHNKDDSYEYQLSPPVQVFDFMLDFDRGYGVFPLEINLTLRRLGPILKKG